MNEGLPDRSTRRPEKQTHGSYLKRLVDVGCNRCSSGLSGRGDGSHETRGGETSAASAVFLDPTASSTTATHAVSPGMCGMAPAL